MKLDHSLRVKGRAASSEPSWKEMYHQAVRLYQNAIDGDPEAAEQAVILLEKVREEVPDHNLALAYHGSALCMLGRDLQDNVQRSAKVIQGLKYLDQAVRNEPDQFEIRMLRGNVCVNLPEMYFHQNSTAVDDFKFLVAWYENDPDDVPEELYFQFLYNLSLAYENLEQTEAAMSLRRKLQKRFGNARARRMHHPEGKENDSLILQPLPVLLEEAEKMHQKALTGEKKHIRMALDFFAKARVLHSDQLIFQAYHADCQSMASRSATNTGELFASAMKSTKALDATVLSEPDNIRIRFIRARHSMRLPELFFARTATAAIDWEYLAKRYHDEPELFTKDQVKEIFYQLGICNYRLGLNQEAEKIWQQILSDTTLNLGEQIEKQRKIHSPLEPVPEIDLQTHREAYYKEARRLHDLGVMGNVAASRLALEWWEKAHKFDPEDPIAEGYYGSALALAGRDSSQINEMFGGAIKGLRIINEALSRDADNWELHLLRGYLCYSLPEVFFHTSNQAVLDFEFLIKLYEQDNRVFSNELYNRIRSDLKNVRQGGGKQQD